MINHSKASAGIIIGVRHDSKPAVILQVRKPSDSFPNACQVTAAGRLEAHEMAMPNSTGLKAGLLRELREEAGQVIAEMVEAAMSSDKVHLLISLVNAKDQLVSTFGWDSNMEASALAKLIVPGQEVGGFRVCTDPSEIQILPPEQKTRGVSPTITAMFSDELNAVNQFFSRLNKS